MEADLDEGSIVATLAEQDVGPCLDGSRGPFLELCLASDTVGHFCHILGAIFFVLSDSECLCLFGVGTDY